MLASAAALTRQTICLHVRTFYFVLTPLAARGRVNLYDAKTKPLRLPYATFVGCRPPQPVATRP